MTEQSPRRVPLVVHLPRGGSPGANSARRCEPIFFGLPLPRGLVNDASLLAFHAGNATLPIQTRVLDRWPDGSIRWALVDFQADFDGNDGAYEIRCSQHSAGQARADHLATSRDGQIVVETGAARFRIVSGGSFPLQEVLSNGVNLLDISRTSLIASGPAGEAWTLSIDKIDIEEPGRIRTAVGVHGWFRHKSKPRLEVFGRFDFFAGSATMKVTLTLRNPRRAEHPGGLWDLGDAGSILLREVALKLTVAGGDRAQIRCVAERDGGVYQSEAQLEVYQDSSGGENWRSTNHLNREHRIPVAFRGYRVRTDGFESSGLRATPIVTLERGERQVSVAVPSFWENFPKAIESDGESLIVSLFPRQFGDLHEIQGGEQKTHTFFVAFGEDRVTEQPLAWCLNPLLASASPEWNCSTGALPYLVPSAGNPNREYVDLQNAAIEGPDTFKAKREVIDEYGWRHFGDIYGDHETVFGPHRDTPLVSHYNNQYDPVAGFAYQYLSSGDARWFAAMNELAAHVTDIDIYHTNEDKSAYNHGLFWHTYHYVDADTATHRSYPAAAKAIVHGGGPSAEQNYATGLMHHYFLTGNENSRRVAIDLAQFVCDLDDGRKTVFRWLDHGATGLATGSGSRTYHGPGRASANSLSVLLDGHRLSGEKNFLDKAEEIIRRCIHPLDDIEANQLLDVERKWFYTMFLQSLGKYLDYKIDRGELDQMYAYGRESLLHYARWMAVNERPYLDKPEILQYPTETWPAQDIRKSDAFNYAAKHASAEERGAFLERAQFFFRYSVTKLRSMPTRSFTRPVVVLLTSGLLDGAFQRDGAIAAPPPAGTVTSFGQPKVFVPQRARAIRRARALIAACAVLALLAAVLVAYAWL